METLFPITIAMGEAFCNRVEERKMLAEYLKHGRHSVLMAARRYGKTSLINQVLLESKLPNTIMEFTLATSVKDIERIISKHVSELVLELLPKTSQAKHRILNLFKWLNPELTLTIGGQKLVFNTNHNKSTVENIAEILKKLDEAAASVKKRVVIVMDEFQELNNISDHNIEAAIRHAMQYSRYVTYVFLGSNRHLLQDMFNSKNRPFYNSCEIIALERIEQNEYENFIQAAAKQKWKKAIPQEVLNCIFQLSELHPSHVNRLCGYFWLTNIFPTVAACEEYWNLFIKSKRTEFTEDISNLSNHQKKILAYLAKNPTSSPSSAEVCQSLEIPESSVRLAIKALLLKDYLYKDHHSIVKILDPAFKAYLSDFS
ncbi:MAG: AAA family ATPase [Gammaproteobacteria bacterium]